MNILIAIPCYGGNVSNLTFHSILNTLRWLNDQGHNIRVETLPTESLINRARNKFVTKFLDNKEFNGTHLLFIDAVGNEYDGGLINNIDYEGVWVGLYTIYFDNNVLLDWTIQEVFPR